MLDSDSVRIPDRQERRLIRERHARAQAEQIATEALERLSEQSQRLAVKARALEAALQTEAQAGEMRRGIVNGAAHVLRTPLTALLMKLHVAQLKATPELLPTVEGATRLAKQLNQAVADMVAAGQIDAGIMPMDPTILDVGEWLSRHELLDMSATDCSETRIIVDVARLDEIIHVLRRVDAVVEPTRCRLTCTETELSITLERPANSPSADELEALGLGTYLASGLALLMGGGLQPDDDAQGQRQWHLWFPKAVSR